MPFARNSTTLVPGCQLYFDRSTWGHNSVLNLLALSFLSVPNSSLFVDLTGYKIPSIITGDMHRPDLLISTSDENLYVLELTVGFESNLKSNEFHKKSKYSDLITQQSNHYKTAKFVNLFVNCLSVFGGLKSSNILKMMQELSFDRNNQNYCTKKIMPIVIRLTYIFCGRNKEYWTNLN